MRDRQIDLLRSQVRAGEHIGAGIAHAVDGLLENFLPLELPLRFAVEAAFVGIGAAHAMNAQDLARFAIAAQALEQQPLVAISGLQHHGGRTVSEQHGDIAIAPVHVRRDQF